MHKNALLLHQNALICTKCAQAMVFCPYSPFFVRTTLHLPLQPFIIALFRLASFAPVRQSPVMAHLKRFLFCPLALLLLLAGKATGGPGVSPCGYSGYVSLYFLCFLCFAVVIIAFIIDTIAFMILIALDSAERFTFDSRYFCSTQSVRKTIPDNIKHLCAIKT